MLHRRQRERLPLRIPVKVVPRNSWLPSYEGECLNVSARGVYIDHALPFEVGDIVEVQLQMPEEIAPPSARKWRCYGKVARVANRAPGGGIGIEFLYYEVEKPGPRGSSDALDRLHQDCA